MKLVTRGFELVSHGFELVTRELKLVARGFELISRGFELLIRDSQLVFYDITFQLRLLFSEQERTQLTEWRRMGKTTKGSLFGWNSPGRRKNSLKENYRGVILKVVGRGSLILVIPHVMYTRKTSLGGQNIYPKK